MYNDTRVELAKRPPINAIEYTYINAAYVDSPLAVGDKKIIAAQGPLPNTIGSFWRMVAEQDVRMIVTTCKLKEGGRTKCEKYWPTDSSFSESLKIPGMSVELGQEEELTPHLVRRTFSLTDEFSG